MRLKQAPVSRVTRYQSYGGYLTKPALQQAGNARFASAKINPRYSRPGQTLSLLEAACGARRSAKPSHGAACGRLLSRIARQEIQPLKRGLAQLLSLEETPACSWRSSSDDALPPWDKLRRIRLVGDVCGGQRRAGRHDGRGRNCSCWRKGRAYRPTDCKELRP